MTTIRWPQIRLGICAVLLTGLLGEWIYILLQPSSDSKNPNPLNIVYPPQVPLPGWQLDKSVPLAAKNKAQTPGHLYQYSHSQETVDIQVHGQKYGDGNVSRYLMVYGFTPPATTLLTIKQQPTTGYYALTSINSQAYLSACLNPHGQSTVTEAQFIQNLNLHGWSPQRALGWLFGLNDFRDTRCFWTILSAPIADTENPQLLADKYAMLEKVWQDWYRWWQPQLKKPELQL